MQKYNGQLIRQFASNVTGNAASGVTVTVRRQSDAGLTTLYVENNIAGATLSNPITTTSTGHFAFYAADGVYTLTFSDGTPQQVVQLQDVSALQAQFDAAVLAGGYIPSGTFSAGATLTQSNQILSDGSSYWRWGGALPKTVTAGSAPTPTGVGNWIVLSDFALRGDLGAAGSTVPVGGVLAGSLALAKWFFITPQNIDTTGATDATSIINAALSSNSHVALPAGDIKITGNLNIAGKVLLGQGKEKTRLICHSPTGNGRFGGSEGNQAAVFSNGAIGSPVYGSTVIGLTIDCNGLLNATGSIGLKGVMFRKSHGCYAKDIRVIDSSSYAFWCADDVAQSDYASAVFEDCEEIGSEIGFEAVNVTTCRFVRCNSFKPRVTSDWPVFSMFHAYTLKDDALVTFENCYGIGYSSTVIDLLLKCRNIKFIGGHFEQLNSSSSALFMSNVNSDYENIDFVGCTMVSAGFGAVLSTGELAPSGRIGAKFTGCSITAKNGVGVEVQGDNGVFEFVNTEIFSTVTGGGAGLCFASSDASNLATVVGGSLKAVGGAGTAISSGLPTRISDQTIQSPSAGALPRIKQVAYGETALINDGGNSFFNATFANASDTSKVVVTAFINATGAADGAAAAAQATTLSFIPIDNQTFRFYASTAAAGRKVRWQLTEYA